MLLAICRINVPLSGFIEIMNAVAYGLGTVTTWDSSVTAPVCVITCLLRRAGIHRMDIATDVSLKIESFESR